MAACSYCWYGEPDCPKCHPRRTGMKIDFSNDRPVPEPPTFMSLKAGDCYTLPGGSTLYQKVEFSSNYYAVNLETGQINILHSENIAVFPRPYCVVKVNG